MSAKMSGGDQSKAKSRVNIGLTFIMWTQLYANVAQSLQNV